MAWRVLLIAVLSLAAGCERVDHDNLEKWTHTESGPGKLRKALANDALDADLSAHAAANLIRRGDDREVFAAFEAMTAGRRAEVAARLAPRLWDIARVENERDLPGSPQVAAKDALIRLLPSASDATR